eukprot:4835483-Pleurochrysis_carterae.AAC.2
MSAQKEIVRIRVLGLGWADCAIAWSKGGKWLTAADSARVSSLPNHQSIPALERKHLPSLGKRTADVASLDALEASSSTALEQAARATKAQREAEGVGDSAQEWQPMSVRVLHACRVGKRIEVLFPYSVPGGEAA